MAIIVAHRGWSGRAPENTMAAFELALTEPRIHFIELDVHLSKDGVPVVIHDHTLERTTNGIGRVLDYTYAELSKLDAGAWFDESFRGERLPRLEDVMRLAKGRCKLAVELKTTSGEYPGIESRVIDLVRTYDLTDQVVLSSFEHESMRLAREIDPTIATGLIYLGKPTLLEEQARYVGATSLAMHHKFVTPDFAAAMIDRGFDVGVWTVDEPEALLRAAALHPDIRITTNHPDRLVMALA